MLVSVCVEIECGFLPESSDFFKLSESLRAYKAEPYVKTGDCS